eukprot:4647049-Pyramimonas_sp.AAC.1
MTRSQAFVAHASMTHKPYLSHALKAMPSEARRMHPKTMLADKSDDLGLAICGGIVFAGGAAEASHLGPDGKIYGSAR